MTAAPPAAPVRPGAVIPEDPFELLPPNAVVAVAMSGGVDSSVAAARCASRGVRTIGITLAMWPRDGEQRRDRGCCSIDAVEDARRVAATIDIPHYSWNLEPEFQRDVVAPFADEYAAGRTPNPCVRCNQTIKFGTLLERARAAGATHVATGHYARIGRRGGRATLHRARAAAKDQAYTLHRLDQDQLLAALFPLGRRAVEGGGAPRGGRARAAHRRQAGFPGAVLRRGLDPGGPREAAGGTLPARTDRRCRGIRGRRAPWRSLLHGGPAHRARPGSPASPDAAPLFVVAVDAAANTITVGPRDALARRHVRLADTHWIDTAPGAGAALDVQLRSHAPPSGATVVARTGDSRRAAL